LTLHRTAQLAQIDLPDFGLPGTEPIIPPAIYLQRMARLKERAQSAGHEVMSIYGDHEHFANLTYLTGYDPRFEEALLIVNVRSGEKPLLLVGNEGWGYTAISPIKDDLEPVLFQSFSLLDQDRSKSRRLVDILQQGGVTKGTAVGVAGWKHFSRQETETPDTWLEIPAYIVDMLRALSGDSACIKNANALFMDSADGLRAINEIEQLARFEFAATYASQAIRNVVFGVRPGMTEFEAVELMRLNGLPFSCHLMLSAGERAFMGLPSPSQRRIVSGEPITTACGVWGALNCRAGFMVSGASGLPTGIQDYVEKLVGPYFEAIAAWYSLIGIGVTGDALDRVIREGIGDPFFGVTLNPGHLIHLDEWVSSPIYAGSTKTLKSGMAIQVDVIPATGSAYFTTNIEDGIALADADLRSAFERQYPEAWGRIQARRAFMQNTLGIELKPEVLPFSNLAAFLPPFWLSPDHAMRLTS
jgi:Xaa-Pro aminopeptidase